MISTEYREAIVEVLEILQHSDDDIIDRIPKKLIEFWWDNKSTTYKPNLDHRKSIDEMELKPKTKAIIGMIYLNYLCDDSEKNNVKLILMDNEERYQQELRQKYNPDDIFKRNTRKQNIIEDVVDTNEGKYRYPIFKKLFGND